MSDHKLIPHDPPPLSAEDVKALITEALVAERKRIASLLRDAGLGDALAEAIESGGTTAELLGGAL